jgi:prepilin peptidase CpaA
MEAQLHLQILILISGIVLFGLAAYDDIKYLRIPNIVCIAVALLGVARLIVIGDASTAIQTLASGAIVFVATFLLFWRGILGGGDVKLLSATVLLVGYNDLLPFLIIMAICGLVVALTILLIHSYFPLWLGPRLAVLVPKARVAVPYGVAIAGSGTVTLLLQFSLIG